VVNVPGMHVTGRRLAPIFLAPGGHDQGHVSHLCSVAVRLRPLHESVQKKIALFV